MIASHEGSVEMAKLLLGRGGVDMDAHLGIAVTPLSCPPVPAAAAWSRPGRVVLLWSEVVITDLRRLLSAAAVPWQHGGTALMIATTRQFTDIVKLLLEHGASPDAADKARSCRRRAAPPRWPLLRSTCCARARGRWRAPSPALFSGAELDCSPPRPVIPLGATSC